MRLFALIIMACLMGLAAPGVLAHDTSLASIQIHVDKNGRVDFQLYSDPAFMAEDAGLTSVKPKGAWKDAPDTLKNLLADNKAALVRWFDAGMTVSADGKPCKGAPEIRQDFRDMPTEAMAARTYMCEGPVRKLTITYGLFYKTDKTHVALGNVFWPGDVMGDFLFDNITKKAVLFSNGEAARSGKAGSARGGAQEGAAGSSLLSRFWHIFLLGIEHILTGYDHILFVLALIIGAPWLKQIVKVVTAFTISHSLTLALAWFGVIDVPSWMVETAIAASIAVVAGLNMLKPGAGHRWMLAGGFGLIHGLGFATALKGLDLANNATMTLLAFNLGVETGQLAIVLALAPVLVWWRGRKWHRTSAIALSGVILAIALFWMIQRAFFL